MTNERAQAVCCGCTLTIPMHKRWLGSKNSDLPDIEKDALTTRRIRPRLNQTRNLSLRGIDLESDSPSDVPAEMVSIRGYYTKSMIVTTSDRPVRALDHYSGPCRDGQNA